MKSDEDSITAAEEMVSSIIEETSASGHELTTLGVAYREPDKWEKNLVSLTKGEWGEDMEHAAFHRYKKSRRHINGISRYYFEMHDII